MIVALVITALAQLASAQLNFGNVGQVGNQLAFNMPVITDIQANCGEASQGGIGVLITFDRPFSGVIYSKGYFNNRNCLLVNEQFASDRFEFIIPSECGITQGTGANGVAQYKNTIIIQMDPLIQEVWDVARTLTCQWVDNFEKIITFNPVNVGMLQAQEVFFSDDKVICTMQILRYIENRLVPLTGEVNIGDKLALDISLVDLKSKYGMTVQSCSAHDSRNQNTRRSISLTNSNGCALRPKLMQGFQTFSPGANGANITSRADFYGFKFPTTSQLFFNCEVRVCKSCAQSQCTGIGASGNSNVFVTRPTKNRRLGSKWMPRRKTEGFWKGGSGLRRH